MNRIQKLSRFFLVFFKFLLVFLPLFAVFKWVFMEAGFMQGVFAHQALFMPLQTPQGTVYLPDLVWSGLTRTIGLAAYLLGLVPLMISLMALIRIFKNYAANNIFNESNAKDYRLIGWMFLFDGILIKSLSDSLLMIAVTLNNAPGHRYVTLSFGTVNMEALFCGAVVIVISWVMLEASKLHEDQQYTV